jgi:hypothetical protein
MNARPLPLAVASGLVVIIGAGLTVVGLLLLAVAAGTIAFLDSARPAVGLLGALALAAAAASFVSAAALWQGRPWAWVASLAIAVAGVTGAVIALSTSGTQAPTVIGLVLTAATVALLIAPSTRTSAGIA